MRALTLKPTSTHTLFSWNGDDDGCCCGGNGCAVIAAAMGGVKMRETKVMVAGCTGCGGEGSVGGDDVGCGVGMKVTVAREDDGGKVKGGDKGGVVRWRRGGGGCRIWWLTAAGSQNLAGFREERGRKRKQHKSGLENPIDSEEEILDADVQQNEAILLSEEEIALDVASSEGTMSDSGSGGEEVDYDMTNYGYDYE
nr:hypothetical protein [Tanacetum cinerariifolium]